MESVPKIKDRKTVQAFSQLFSSLSLPPSHVKCLSCHCIVSFNFENKLGYGHSPLFTNERLKLRIKLSDVSKDSYLVNDVLGLPAQVSECDVFNFI